MFIDTHSHIYLPDFDKDREEILSRAQGEGINLFLLPAIDSSTHELMIGLEKMHPNCKAMIGLHPCSVRENFGDELEIVKGYLEKRSFVAIGEIGLDFYWDKTYIKQQYEVFHQQINLALKYNLPIVIHSRSSMDECIDLVKGYQSQGLRGVFHCFSGNLDQAKRIIDLGFLLGIGGVLTFKNAGLDKVLGKTDLGHIVLETDSPYLSPVPFRGKRNEPAYLSYVVQKLSEIKGIGRAEIENITTANAYRIFSIPKQDS